VGATWIGGKKGENTRCCGSETKVVKGVELLAGFEDAGVEEEGEGGGGVDVEEGERQWIERVQ
jgi:hypothetical protein